MTRVALHFRAGIKLADEFIGQPGELHIEPPESCCNCLERLQAYHTDAAGCSSQTVCSSPSEQSCPAYTPVRVTIREGKFHQVKRMLAQVGGFGVHRLHRESFGPLSLSESAAPDGDGYGDVVGLQLPVGVMRPMTEDECGQVRRMLPASRGCEPARVRSQGYQLAKDIPHHESLSEEMDLMTQPRGEIGVCSHD